MHTPGPWVYGVDADTPVDHRTYKSPGYFDNIALYGLNGEFVVGCNEYHVFGSENDMQLIAAAPELLDALKGMMDLRNGCDHGNWTEAKRKAAAAIAKAEGGAL